MIQPLDWKLAFQKWCGTYLPWESWGRSRECHAMRAEANGKTAAEWAKTAFIGMAGGYAKIAAHHAFQAYPELREQSSQ